MNIKGITKRIGDFFASRRGEKTTFDKVGILGDAEELAETLVVLAGSIRSSDTADALQSVSLNPRPETDAARAIVASHTLIMNNIDSSFQRQERMAAFSSFAMLAEVMARDMELIRTKYDVFFGASTSSDIELKNVRMSMALTLGYMAQAYQLCTWGVHLLSVVGAAAGKESVPPYQTKSLKDYSVYMAKLLVEILGRRANTTFMDTVLEMRKKGTDVYVDTGSETVADYSHDTDYSVPMQRTLDMFERGPLNMRSGRSIAKRYEKYQSLKDMREFMQARVRVITLDMTKMDPDSPEYKKAESILRNYAALIARNDKRIADYEGS